MSTDVGELARHLYRDDLSRADELPVCADGRKAYDGWLQSSSDAGDRDTREELESVDREEFAKAWESYHERRTACLSRDLERDAPEADDEG